MNLNGPVTVCILLIFFYAGEAKKSKAVRQFIKFALGLPHARRLATRTADKRATHSSSPPVHDDTLGEELRESRPVAGDGFVPSHFPVASNAISPGVSSHHTYFSEAASSSFSGPRTIRGYQYYSQNDGGPINSFSLNTFSHNLPAIPTGLGGYPVLPCCLSLPLPVAFFTSCQMC